MRLNNTAARRATMLLTIVALVIFIISGLVWTWSKWTDPEAAFNAMLANSLRTQSVAKTINQAQGNQSLEQIILFNDGADEVVFADTTITQTGQQSATIKTENIGTPNEEYVRYTTIETNQQNAAGEQFDFTDALNVWGKIEANETGLSAGPQLYEEFAFGAIPVGFLSQADHAEVLEFIQNNKVYEVDFDSVTNSWQDKRPVMVYNVSLNTRNYIETLKLFGRKAGLDRFEAVDASTYPEGNSVQIQVTVDSLTRRLDSIRYQDGREESFMAYGIQKDFALPTESIPVNELQARIQDAQQ